MKLCCCLSHSHNWCGATTTDTWICTMCGKHAHQILESDEILWPPPSEAKSKVKLGNDLSSSLKDAAVKQQYAVENAKIYLAPADTNTSWVSIGSTTSEISIKPYEWTTVSWQQNPPW